MSPYEFGYITGVAFTFLIVSWLLLKAVKPATRTGLNLTLGILAAILIIGQSSAQSAGIFVGSIVSIGLAYFFLYRAHARKLAAPRDDITTLSLTAPLPAGESPSGSPDVAPSGAPLNGPLQGEPISSGPAQSLDRSTGSSEDQDTSTAEAQLASAGARRPDLAAPYSRAFPGEYQPAVPETPRSTRTAAMLTAAIILFINATILLLEWGLVAIGKTHSQGPGPGVAAVLFNVACGIGLLRGSHRARRWVLVFAVIGGIASLIVPITGFMSFTWPMGILQAVYAAGMVVILAGERPSLKRVFAGASAVVVGWGGIFAVGFVTGIRSVVSGTGVEEYALTDRAFADEQSGINLDLPSGWSLLSNSNPVVKVQDARAIAFHPKSGCLAALVIEPVAYEAIDLDKYLDALMEVRQKDLGTLRETGREAAEMGGKPARRLYMQWAEQNTRFRGFSTVLQDSFDYYLLTGWCADSALGQSLPAFQELERGFRLTKSEERRLDDIAAPLVFDAPYLSDKTARRLAGITKRIDPQDRHSIAYEVLQESVRHLPSGDQSEFAGILGRAFSSLPRQDYARLRADQAQMMKEEQLDADEIDWYQKTMTTVYRGIPDQSRQRLEKLADKAIDRAFGNTSAPIEPVFR